MLFSCVDNSLSEDIESDNKRDNNSNLSNKLLTDETIEHIKTLLENSFLTWWQAIHVGGASFIPQVMADAATSSWGNYGMRHLSSEPRAEFDNTQDYQYQDGFADVMWNLYSCISAMTDIRRSLILDGIKLETDSVTTRAKAYSNFLLGISYGSLATIYDKAIFFDETTDFSNPLSMKDYTELNDLAIGYLKKSIAISDTSDYDIPKEWMKVENYTNDSLIALGHSFIARYTSSVARTQAERNALDWTEVKSNAEKGITFSPVGDGDYWWSRPQYYAGNSASWGRADYKMLGPADKSTGYANWLGDGSDATIAGRAAYSMETDDARITGPLDTDGKQTQGLYASNEYRTRLIASRGTYHQTYYLFNRTRDYAVTLGLNGPMHDITIAELDLLQAEAALRSSDAATAATLINKTRVGNGALTAAAAADGLGSIADAPNALDGGSLWAKYKYEAILENCYMHPYTTYAFRRGWGDLVKGTLTMFPIPGDILEYMLLDYYTFGGQSNAGKPGTAGKRKFNIGQPTIKARLQKFPKNIEKLQ